MTQEAGPPLQALSPQCLREAKSNQGRVSGQPVTGTDDCQVNAAGPVTGLKVSPLNLVEGALGLLLLHRQEAVSESLEVVLETASRDPRCRSDPGDGKAAIPDLGGEPGGGRENHLSLVADGRG